MPVFSVDIEAHYAKFTDAMTAIEQKAKKSAKGIESSFSPLNSFFAGLASAISVGALVELVKHSIDAADHLNDLSKKTGVAVDVLGGIGFAAAQAGSSLDGVSDVVGKLNKSIAEAGSGDKQIGAAFKKLGIDVEDGTGALKKADAILIELADKFPQYAEGPEKAALANAIFKKSYAEILPLLADGGEALRKNIEYYQKYSGVTQDIAEKSDAFNDTLEKIKLLSGAAGNQITAELLPTLQELADKMVEVKESSSGFSEVGKAIATVIDTIAVLGVNTKYVFSQVGNEIGGIASQLAALGRLDFKGFSRIGEMMREDAKAAREEVDRVTAEILSPNKGQLAKEVQDALDEPKAKKKTAPRLPGTGPDGAKQLLEGRLKDLERQNERERELLATRNEFLQDAYQKDLIAISDYYAARKAASDEALAAQVANIDEEITLLQKHKAKDASEKAENESKIKELVDKRKALEQKAGLDAIKNIQAQADSYEQLKRAIEDVNTQLLEQQGLSGQAAARRFDEQNRQYRQRLESQLAAAQNNGDSPRVVEAQQAIKDLDSLRDVTVAQGKLNDLQQIGSRIQSDLGIATERAQIAAENGSITELESLRKISDARSQAVVDMQAVADAYTGMAAKTGNPAIVQHAKELQVQVEKLAGSADLVRKKFEDAFSTSFESFFEKLASGTASLKDAIKGIFSDIAGEINKIAARKISQSLFEKDGPLGGIVDIAAKAFGGKSAIPQVSSDVASSVAKAAGSSIGSAGTDLASTAAAAQITAMTTAATGAGGVLGTLATTVLPSLTFAADAAATALSSVAGTSGASAISNGGSFIGLFSDLSSVAAKGNIYTSGNVIPFAKGGIPEFVNTPTLFPMSGGRTGLMGEAGPEAIVPLHRDKQGGLAIKMLGERGVSEFLPLTRDSSGKLAVMGKRLEKFATGGVFPTNAANVAFPTTSRFNVAPASALAVPISGQSEGTTNNTSVSVNVPQSTSQESATQIAARTAAAVARANRRNN